MHDAFGVYIKKAVNNLNTAIVNIFMFLPYFFSVEHTLKTLFAPWKNITSSKTKPGFSFSDFGKRFGDNLVSRFMGFGARSAILAAFIMIQVFFVMFIPLIYLMFIVTLPIQYGLYTSRPTPEERKKHMFQDFTKRHLVEPDNMTHIVEWFEIYYQDLEKKPWWSTQSLMSQPPLGRDLTSGYTPVLDQYSHELTLDKPHYKHLIGRKGDLDRIIQIMLKTGEANVLLVGEKGIGKHAVIEALAKLIYDGKSGSSLAYKRILELNMEKILATETDFAKREETVSKMFEEAIKAKNIIIYIPNLDTYVSDEKDHVNLTNIIDKFAKDPNIHFISTTTPYAYQKYIYPNKVIAQAFDKVEIEEVTKEQAIRILLDIALQFEKKHGIKISYEGIQQAVLLSDKFIATGPLPEKAIELLDEACVYARKQSPNNSVNSHIINTVVQQKTHIPTEISASMKQKLLNLENSLRERIIQQDAAITQLSAALRKSFVMAGVERRPLASFLFLGPTGVGKTETAKSITSVFFDDERNMIRFDMSLYQSKDDITRLVGSQENNEPGLLTQAIRQQRFGTLLLDELEKAHPDLLNIFLTILDEGYFTDGYGKRVDCTHLLIIATSNAGADFIYKKVQENALTDISSELVDYLVAEKIYSPEFLNRFDGVVVYKPLAHDAVEEIAKKMLSNIKNIVEEKHNIKLSFSDQFIIKLITEGYDPRFGARNLKRIVRDQVEDKVAKEILQGTLKKGQSLHF